MNDFLRTIIKIEHKYFLGRRQKLWKSLLKLLKSQDKMGLAFNFIHFLSFLKHLRLIPFVIDQPISKKKLRMRDKF